MYFKIALIAIAAISVINFFAYAIDKIKAKFSWWRIPEKTLLLTSFFGGAPGGCLLCLFAVTRHVIGISFLLTQSVLSGRQHFSYISISFYKD